MTKFVSALATGSDWKDILADVGAQLPEGDAQAGGLGLIYATEPLADHFSDMMLTLRQRTGVKHWVGCVGCVGMGVCGQMGEYHDEPALSVLIAPWSEESFKVFPTVSSADALPDTLSGDWASSYGPVFGLAHGDPRNRHLGEIVDALPTAGEGYFVGGLTSLSDTAIQVADEPTGGGLSGVLISAEVPVMVTHSQGCSPVGPYHQVTAGERSIVETLDNRPALDVLKEDIGEVLARDLNRIGGYIHVAMPVPGSDTGDYTVRNLVGIDPNGGMIAVGDDIHIGDRIMFVRRDPESAQKDFTERLTELKARIGDTPVRGGLFVSCVARGAAMFGEAGREVGIIQDILGDFPLTGFYANGEFCGNRMYGYTGVLSVFL
ncbi:MAG: histidine kinase [Rhodospirillaceae bacterium]|nr:histidine kinase [Rhodospirillaceae bacterium]